MNYNNRQKKLIKNLNFIGVTDIEKVYILESLCIIYSSNFC
jgi:hypothetical protein